jgi:hypothetical protein
MILNFNLFENIDQAKSILNRNGIDQSDKFYLEVKDLLTIKNKLGFLGWAIKLRFDQLQKPNDIVSILKIIINDNFKDILPFFEKDVIDINSCEEFYDNLELAKKRKKAKSIWNQFTSEQKNLIDWKEYTTILNLLYDNPNKSDFIKKISRYKTKSHLLDDLKSFLNNKHKEFNQLVSDLNGMYIEIKHMSLIDDIIICRVEDSTQVRKIAGDTSWCIKNQYRFDEYVRNEFDNQWVIFLTDEPVTSNYRKIGLTTGIDFKNCHLSDDKEIGINYIKDILKSRGVNIEDLYSNKPKEYGGYHKFTQVSIKEFRSYPIYKDIPSDVKRNIDKQFKMVLNSYRDLYMSNIDLLINDQIYGGNMYLEDKYQLSDLRKNRIFSYSFYRLGENDLIGLERINVTYKYQVDHFILSDDNIDELSIFIMKGIIDVYQPYKPIPDIYR